MQSTTERVPKVSILGAGRLGRRLAQRWATTVGVRPFLWSRRFDDGGMSVTADGDDPTYQIVTWEKVFAADVVLIAIPGSAFLPLASSRGDVLTTYQGVVGSANLDLQLNDLQRIVPRAHVIRFAPFLLPTRSDISSLVVQATADDPRWLRVGRLVMETLGPFDVVAKEEVYETLLLLGSPFPMVLNHAFRSALKAFCDEHGLSSEDNASGERVFWRAVGAIANSASDPSRTEAVESVATPGGVTAEGLRNDGDLVEAARHLISRMLQHSNKLKNRIRGAE
jgi:pyrroline-5-carboxylate reductase